MVDAQTVGVLVTATSVTVAAIYYIFTLRMNMRTQELALKTQQQNLETRQAQLFMQIYLRYLEPDLFSDNLPILFNRSWKDAEDYMKKYGTELDGRPRETINDGGNLHMMMAFFEGIAVLINRGMLDISLMYEIMPTNVTAFWGRYGPLIKEMRTMGYPPRLYCLVEELSDKLTEYARGRSDQIVTDYTAPTLRPSEDSTK